MDKTLAKNDLFEGIIYAGVPEGFDCLTVRELAYAEGNVLVILRDDKRIATVAEG